MPRPLWKGHLSFGLVMMPVVLFSGTASEAKIDLDMLDERDHERIRFMRVNERTRKEVPWKSIVKGYEYEEGKYVVLTPEDFKAAASQVARGGVEIVEFVDRQSINPLLFEQPYYLTPGKGGEKVYALLRDTLKKSDRVGIAKLVIQTREHLAALMVQDNTLALTTIRFAEELRDPDELPVPTSRAKASPAEIQMAQKLIDSMTAEWDPRRYKNEYTAALKRVIRDKSRGPGGGKKAPRLQETEEPPESYNIMELLRKSVATTGRTAKRSTSRAPAKHPTRRKAG